MRSRLIGIAGPSCSGKTSVAKALAHRLAPASLVQADSYYRDLSHLTPRDRDRQNFDHPAAIEHELLAAHLRLLITGSTVECPRYDFASHTRRRDALSIESWPIVIVEGLYVLHWPEIRDLLDVGVLLWADHKHCLERRINRDCLERHRTPEFVRLQYERDVRPMCDQYIQPTARHADVVVESTAPLEDSIAESCELVMQNLAGGRRSD